MALLDECMPLRAGFEVSKVHSISNVSPLPPACVEL